MGNYKVWNGMSPTSSGIVVVYISFFAGFLLLNLLVVMFTSYFLLLYT